MDGGGCGLGIEMGSVGCCLASFMGSVGRSLGGLRSSVGRGSGAWIGWNDWYRWAWPRWTMGD